jgi:hypothetical protein
MNEWSGRSLGSNAVMRTNPMILVSKTGADVWQSGCGWAENQLNEINSSNFDSFEHNGIDSDLHTHLSSSHLPAPDLPVPHFLH